MRIFVTPTFTCSGVFDASNDSRSNSVPDPRIAANAEVGRARGPGKAGFADPGVAPTKPIPLLHPRCDCGRDGRPRGGAPPPMASAATPSLLDPATHAARWIADYCTREQRGDVLCADSADPSWAAVIEELAAIAGDDLGKPRERLQRQAAAIGPRISIIRETDA